MEKVWLNGALVDRGDAKISVFDHGLVTGDGVFETVGVYGGRPFVLGRHLVRLQRSASGIGLGDLDLKRIERGVAEVLEVNECGDGKVRITVTGGDSVLGSDRSGAPLSVIIAAAHRPPSPPTARVQVAPWPKNEKGILAGLKTISYADNVAALAWAKSKGADEVIFGNIEGNLCEGSGSNIFLVVGGEMFTPPLSSGALGGITREIILERLEVAERDFPLSILYSDELDECFLSSSIREAQAISHIDGVPTKSAPGPFTLQVAEAFSKIVAEGRALR